MESPDLKKTEEIRAYLRQEYDYFDLVEVLKEKGFSQKELEKEEIKKLIDSAQEVVNQIQHERGMLKNEIKVFLEGRINRLEQRIRELNEPPFMIGIYVRPLDKEGMHEIFDYVNYRIIAYMIDDIEINKGDKIRYKFIEAKEGGRFVILERHPGKVDTTLGEIIKIEGRYATVRFDTYHEMMLDIGDFVDSKNEYLKAGAMVTLFGNSKDWEILDIKPNVKYGDDLLLEKRPKVKRDDIGGLDEAILEIDQAVGSALSYDFIKEKVQKLKIERTKGIMLYGPPGCGKTLIARYAASISSRNFINVDKELRSKWFGETQQNIEELFKYAEEKAPSVLFFDEFDSLVPERESGSEAARLENPIVNKFLQLLDGLEEMGDVIVIIATNRPDIIDPAILRPGRIDKHIRIGRPDTREAGEKILNIYLKPENLIPHVSEIEKYGSVKNFSEAMKENILNELYEKNRICNIEKLGLINVPIKETISGAMIKNIVIKTKKYYINRLDKYAKLIDVINNIYHSKLYIEKSCDVLCKYIIRECFEVSKELGETAEKVIGVIKIDLESSMSEKIEEEFLLKRIEEYIDHNEGMLIEDAIKAIDEDCGKIQR
ncbi:MAG: VCP-like ATPase [Candidatus Methanofastidiosum methylothiophilum]|uniref:VCP-like ATPase n=1 Tax=Candidatus Methanofastidiosum methylothiophilum TaxID=1705564 RepID=A0A150IU72_9EURY|nr:MAG: VCP-like ATPase [Candidatus Methanofastidiosum methylthiophilus]